MLNEAYRTLLWLFCISFRCVWAKDMGIKGSRHGWVARFGALEYSALGSRI